MESNKLADAEMIQKLGINKSSSHGKKWSRIIFIALVIILIIIISSFLKSGNRDESSYFKIEEVETGSLTVTVTATGTLTPTKQVDVGSELSGILETVEARYNDRVKVGQVLAKLDGSRYEAQVMQSKASLESAQADVLNAWATEQEARSRLGRLREVWKLSGEKVPSKTELEAAEAALQRAKAALATAQARVSQARATLEENQTNISKLVIRSPINGIVLNRAYEPGQTVQASFQGVTLFTIAEDLSRMELHVDVDEADVGNVKEGQKATFTVYGYPDRTFQADIAQVRYGSKTVSGVVTYETILNVDNSELLLRPGMTATADIIVDKLEDVMLIDNGAFRYSPSEKDLAVYSGGKDGFLKGFFSRSPKSREKEKEAEATEPEDIRTKKIWTLRDKVLVPVTITTGLTDGFKTEVKGDEIKPCTPVIVGTESKKK